MLTIGEFSKICKVSTRTLRHYDSIDLIKPKKINEENGYRYYEIDQVKEMIMIERLKKYQFSLDEINEILHSNTNILLDKIIVQEKKIKNIISQYREIEKQMKDDILRLKKGFDIMTFVEDINIKLIDTEDINILSSRQLMSTDEYGKYIGKLFEIISKNNLTVIGPPMSIYYGSEFNEDENDTEIAVPIKENFKGTKLLPGGLYATATIKGAYSNLSFGYGKLIEWINKNNYKITGEYYEKYLKGPMDGGEIITEIYIPLIK
ncbi:Transcriptional regulator, MerR family [Clostridium bornimense]|uniref:Transcriptional regulator, MerR family n=1 Tax=Clostridium bornimense TaxID=1216932 RepID=W6RZX6_9CLOT|nr:GyrI-like domain-containing protein [Clostridium bornimense]CDM70211.1 Transcriptional regulator, MerR family [Clostridium bornimense]